MDIEVLGAWGELVGGVGGLIAALGVIVTLIYLARQIQQNTKSVQSTNYATWISSVSAVHDIQVGLSDWVDDAVNDARELNSDEFWRFHALCIQAMYMFEAVFLFNQNGTVDPEFFESRMRMFKNGVIDRPGYSKWWDDWADDVLDPRFVAYVEEHLKGQSTHILPSFGVRS